MGVILDYTKGIDPEILIADTSGDYNRILKVLRKGREGDRFLQILDVRLQELEWGGTAPAVR